MLWQPLCIWGIFADKVRQLQSVLYKEQQDRAVRAVTNAAAATIRGLWLQAVSGWQTREQATLILVVVVKRSSHKEPKVN